MVSGVLPVVLSIDVMQLNFNRLLTISMYNINVASSIDDLQITVVR